MGARAWMRRAGVWRARGRDRGACAGSERRIADGATAIASGGVRGAGPGECRIRRSGNAARCARVRVPVQGRASGREQRVQRDLARNAGAGRAPSGAGRGLRWSWAAGGKAIRLSGRYRAPTLAMNLNAHIAATINATIGSAAPITPAI